jgi:6-phosphogluconate dehydrogenase
MQLGMIGLGRMGANMVRRLLRGGHHCVVYDVDPHAAAALGEEGAATASDVPEFARRLVRPRAVWLMVPAAAVDNLLEDLLKVLEAGDLVVDGGNSHYKDDRARQRRLEQYGLQYVDVGTSGGVWGLERGYCLMIGGEKSAVKRLDPIFACLAPGIDAAVQTAGRVAKGGSVEQGYLHCGPAGAGHFVKMVHNGIEYGLMAAYAEGLNILRHANVGKHGRAVHAQTTPLQNPVDCQYDLNLADVAEVWRRGSVISSWLLDLIARALLKDPDLAAISGRVADSGEGRWTIQTAIDLSVPTPVLSAALSERFASRGEAEFADKVCSAMRYEFGGHEPSNR